jgi:glutamyl-tRNA synthetase
MSIVTRFAPSPTGYLHIGGARTALFNWLYARANGGQYLLRIEDTDLARSNPEAVEAIYDGLQWLGIVADGKPVLQSENLARHRDVALAMVARGTAFACYMSDEEVEVERAKAHAEGRAFRSTWRDRKPGAVEGKSVIRLRAPDDALTVEDKVQGEVTVAGKEIDDLILLRSDGTPTYLLAVVVDDHDMGVTQVIRGVDHLTNTFRQVPIYRGMGWTPPLFAHIPLIHGPDGAKLSKRHGALAVQAYRDMGYLPEAVFNYLLRLGWSHGDAEIISRKEAVAHFNLESIGRGPARIDFDKLAAVNSHYMKEADDARLLQLALAIAEHQRNPLSQTAKDRLRVAIPGLKVRSKTVADLLVQAEVLWLVPPLSGDEKSIAKLAEPESSDRLKATFDALDKVDQGEWAASRLSDALHSVAKQQGVGFGKLGPYVRAALTGGRPATDLGALMEWIGKSETLARVSAAVAGPLNTLEPTLTVEQSEH